MGRRPCLSPAQLLSFQLRPGDTLYLRSGVYYENVYCAVAGTKEALITLRSYPGELAVLDGGLREFAEQPAKAWVPYPDGGKGEYRSARAYRNIRDVVGLFGDSLIGLQTYWHAMDLLETARECQASQHNKAKYPAGWEANSLVAEPRFVQFEAAPEGKADYRLRKDSPAVGKGVVLPKEWDDPLRPRGGARPDIRALPLGSANPRFGRQGRVTFPITGRGKKPE
jgi:hypothetical protein